MRRARVSRILAGKFERKRPFAFEVKKAITEDAGGRKGRTDMRFNRAKVFAHNHVLPMARAFQSEEPTNSEAGRVHKRREWRCVPRESSRDETDA